MNLPKARGVLKRMVQARMKRLHSLGPFLAGSLVAMPKHNSRYLTDKPDQKTRTLYIPLARLKEVKRWNDNFKLARQLLRELSEIRRALLRAEIEAERRNRATS